MAFRFTPSACLRFDRLRALDAEAGAVQENEPFIDHLPYALCAGRGARGATLRPGDPEQVDAGAGCGWTRRTAVLCNGRCCWGLSGHGGAKWDWSKFTLNGR
jgi:hypothetical protein